ncbi:retrovirus-related pol polyprotein from transposon TNT 1-94 [Tanacetum coccineum]
MSFLSKKMKALSKHYKELYDSIKITRAKHLEQTTALLTENESLKVQIQNKLSCVNKDHVKPKVLAPGKYAIDVEPIPPRNRNNREVHLVYLKHLKERYRETLREIVEEAKVERPLDSSLASACRYTKHSQELLEYVIDTCPKALNTTKNFNKFDSTSLLRKSKLFCGYNVQCQNAVPQKGILCGRTGTQLLLYLDNFVTLYRSCLKEAFLATRHDEVLSDLLVVQSLQEQIIVMASSFKPFERRPQMFLWAEAVATACYTQNRSLIHTRHCKTPYELVHDKKPDLTFFRVFGALCYPTNDSEDLGKLQPTVNIAKYSLCNSMSLTEQMAPVQLSTGPAPTFLTPGQISSGLVPNPVPAAPYVPSPHSQRLWKILFNQCCEYLEPPRVERPVFLLQQLKFQSTQLGGLLFQAMQDEITDLIDFRSISENKGKVPTEMELVLEYTQQGSSHKLSVSTEGVEELKGIVKIKGVKKEALHSLRQKPVDIEQVAVSSSLRLLEPKRTIESRAKRSTINLVRTQHPSETLVFYNEDGNPARANIKQALGSYERPHKGVKASANSDVMYFFTSAQDGNQLQNDERLCLGDDLKGDLP